ncbi:spectrin repeat-containing domain protein, partial [Ancylostoma duodenale]
VHDALSLLHRDVEQRHLLLSDAFVVATFDRDVADTEAWIDEKLKGIRLEKERQGQCTSIEDKMKRLQKHQALEAELAANRKRVDQVLQRGKELQAKHRDAGISARCDGLYNRWMTLVDACSEQSRALEEARDLLTFRQLVDRVLSWAHERELMVTAGEMGRDLEHCKLLIDRLDGTQADSSVDEQTLDQINRLGEKLIGQGRTSREEVQQQQQNLNQTWNALHGKLAAYRRELTAALEVHAFNRDVDDTNERIHEKIAAMRSDDYGRDFATENLREAHALYQWTACAEEELEWLADKLPLARSQECGDSLHAAHSLQKKHAALEKELDSRQDAASVRRARLQQAVDSHEYYTEVAEAEQWIRDQMPVATNQETGRDQAAAEGYLRRLAVLDKEVRAQLGELRSGWDELRTKSALKTQRLREAYEAHTLQRKVEDMERWLDRIEGELTSEDHGRDLISVEHLVKKLDALDAEIRGRADAVHDLMLKAREIKTLGSPTSDAILSAAEQVEARYSSLNEPVSIR